MYPYASLLDFQHTNNEDEYEALIQAIEIANDLGIKSLIMMGDSELVVNHVKNKCQVKKCKLKAYIRRVRKFVEYFSAFNVMFIHRHRNHRTYSLAILASLFNQNNLYMANPFKVGMLYRPIFPDNKEFWKVFWKVMNTSQNFKDLDEYRVVKHA